MFTVWCPAVGIMPIWVVSMDIVPVWSISKYMVPVWSIAIVSIAIIVGVVPSIIGWVSPATAIEGKSKEKSL